MKRAWKESRSLAATGLVFGCAVLFLAFLGVSVWDGYKTEIIDRQKEQMMRTVQSVCVSFEQTVEAYQADLDGLCRAADRLDRTDGDMRESIDEYVDTHAPMVLDVLLETEDGTPVYSSRGSRVLENSTDIEIDGEFGLSQSRLEDGNSVLVIRRKLEDGRSAAVLLDEEIYYENLISELRIGENGYIVIKDSSNHILMHPDRRQWGIETISGRAELYPEADMGSLAELLERQMNGEEGIMEYESYWWTSPKLPRVKKISAYSPVWLGDDFLVVSAVMDYDDIYVPLVNGMKNLLLICVGFLLSLAFLGWSVYRMAAQSKKDQEEIAYLQKLNGVLQEMHRSEETIAHQQRLQIMGTMTGGIAHEFNNLLTPIMGYADLLLMELPEDSEAYEEAMEIYDASAKAKDLIQQISSLSRKNMETAYRNIAVGPMLRRALKMVRSVCPANIVLKEELDFTDQCMLGNETQLNQVILNICVNAIHAIGRREDGELVIRGREVSKEALARWEVSAVPDVWQRYIEVVITDNGCGMTREVMDSIFNPFFTTKENGKGTGLGLALVEQVTHSHKGRIFVESTVGEGSSFYLYFPINERRLEEAETHNARGGELRLLVVDDNAKVLKLLERNFAKLGVAADFCMDFEEAGRLLAEHGYDAMAAEQSVQGKSAVDFCMSIHGRFPELIKVIMADYITRELAEARDRGIIDEYIDKPVSDAAILGAVKKGREARHEP